MRVLDLANTVKAFELNLTNRYLTLGASGFSDEGSAEVYSRNTQKSLSVKAI